MDARYERYKDFSSAPRPWAEKRKVWLDISDNLTGEKFDAMMAENKARQARVPTLGSAAPDFKIERLSSRRQRSGEFVTLSSLRGRPVALAFGSYT